MDSSLLHESKPCLQESSDWLPSNCCGPGECSSMAFNQAPWVQADPWPVR